jgi:hypothetical protein
MKKIAVLCQQPYTECQDAETAIEKFRGLRETCFGLFESLAHTLRVVRTQKEEREEAHGTTSRTVAAIAVKREHSAEKNIDPQNVAARVSTLSARVAEACRRYAAQVVPPEVLDMSENPSNNNLLEWLGRLELICKLEFNEETVCDKDLSPAMAGYAPTATLALTPTPRRTSNSSSRSRSSSNFSFARFHKPGKKWKSFDKKQRRLSQGDGLQGLEGTQADSLLVDLQTLHSRAKQAVAARLRPPIAVRFGDQM